MSEQMDYEELLRVVEADTPAFRILRAKLRRAGFIAYAEADETGISTLYIRKQKVKA